MSDSDTTLSGPDLTKGVELSAIPDRTMLLGHAEGEPVLLARRGDEVFAIGAICTHYGAPLTEGLLVGETVRCPWHHACFDLRTGEALRAPALDPVSHWRVEQVHDLARQFTPTQTPVGAVFVREKMGPAQRRPTLDAVPKSVIIVGGGAAGNAAAEMLRREGYLGPVTLFSADPSRPPDRPNLSKGYLSGAASDDSNLLRPAKFYEDRRIDLKLDARVLRLDVSAREIELTDGSRHSYGALLLATGAEPVRLDIPGCDLPHVHYLRTLADSRAIVAKALCAKRAVVIGASFIGLEVAASLRARNVEVDMVAPETIPMEKILGPKVGAFLRKMHEDHGVTFHLGATAASIAGESVTLASGEVLRADLVVIGVGVRPLTGLAESAGLAVDRGVTVDEYLQTSVAGVFAAGDIARWPDPLSGERIRVEHFVVAERQGQTAARNILGRREAFDAVPFFWTEQYDLGLAYVGHGEGWDRVDVDGSLEARDCAITFSRAGETLATAFVHRDLEGLRAELALEKKMAEKPSS
ncbi:MAG TPA: FAD-dependent oxidoreductase [Caulobacteraceae bacterium]